MGWTWGITVASIVGTVLNIRKRRVCFAIWFFTNLAWTGIDIWKGIYSQAALQAVYVGLAVWGWVTWRGRGE